MVRILNDGGEGAVVDPFDLKGRCVCLRCVALAFLGEFDGHRAMNPAVARGERRALGVLNVRVESLYLARRIELCYVRRVESGLLHHAREVVHLLVGLDI